MAHAALGGAMGFVLSEGKLAGAALGAISGASSEIIAEEAVGTLVRDVLDEEIEKAARENRPLKPQDYFTTLETRIQTIKDFTKLGLGVGAMLTKQNVKLSADVADNAISNNFAPAVIAVASLALTAAKISWEVASIVYEEEIEATKQEIAKMVGDRIGVEPIYVEHTIDVMMMVGSLTQTLKQGGKWVLKKVVKAEGKALEKGAKAEVKAIQKGVKAQTPRVETKVAPKPSAQAQNPKSASAPKKLSPQPQIKEGKQEVPTVGEKGVDVSDSKELAPQVHRVTREKRWVELAEETNSQLPKEMVDHIKRHNGKGVYKRFGQELAHRPKKAAAQGHDYAEAIPKTAADHRGIQHKFLKERKTGTSISIPKNSKDGKLTLPKKGSLP